MKIEHLAIWTRDLEAMRVFYLKYFPLKSNEKYTNTKKLFTSYFLSFESGARIELMHRPDVSDLIKDAGMNIGLAHFAVSVGAKEKVDALTERMRQDGHEIFGEPRTTGDGYYESVVRDIESNLIEITV